MSNSIPLLSDEHKIETSVYVAHLYLTLDFTCEALGLVRYMRADGCEL